MSAEQQTKILAHYIIAEIPGEPSQDEGAGDTAIRLLKRYTHALRIIVRELSIPGEGYPAPAMNALGAAKAALRIQD